MKANSIRAATFKGVPGSHCAVNAACNRLMVMTGSNPVQG